MRFLLLTAVLLPLLLAPAVYFIAKRSLRSAYAISLASAIAETALFAYLFFADVKFSVSVGSVPALFALGSDGFRSLYALVASFMWSVTTALLPEYLSHYKNRERLLFFWLVTFSATLGVFLSTDLATTFIFFEIVSFASFVWVLHDETEDALSAAKTYLATAIFGGMIMLLGLVFLYEHTGTLAIAEISAAVSDMPQTPKFISGLLLLFGFAAKAGMIPLHIWLPKAHPVAPAPASALLSGVLTKVGIYGIVVVSVTMFYANAKWGAMLMIFGVATLLLGAFLALVSVNLKRTLACSSMSQIGFIVTGIAAASVLGEHNSAAATGVVLYMLNHSMMKLILFSAAGVLYMNIHKLDLNSIRGWGRGKPLFCIAFIIGGAGLAGIPGTGGYVAKTLIHEAILECVGELAFAKAAEILFLVGGGCTLAYMTKLFVILFIEKPENDADEHTSKRYENPTTTLALAAACVPVLFTGIPAVSEYIGRKTAFFVGGEPALGVEFFGWECLSGAVYTVLIGVAVYFLFVRTVTKRKNVYVNILPSWADLEKSVYVPVIKGLTSALTFVARFFGENVVSGAVYRFAKAALIFVAHALSDLLDIMIYAAKRTVFRASDAKRLLEKEENIVKHHPIRDSLRTEVTILSSGVTDNFSYALIVTAIGVCVIIFAIILSI